MAFFLSGQFLVEESGGRKLETTDFICDTPQEAFCDAIKHLLTFGHRWERSSGAQESLKAVSAGAVP